MSPPELGFPEGSEPIVPAILPPSDEDLFEDEEDEDEMDLDITEDDLEEEIDDSEFDGLIDGEGE